MCQTPSQILRFFALANRNSAKIGKLVQNKKTPFKNVPNTLVNIAFLCTSK